MMKVRRVDGMNMEKEATWKGGRYTEGSLQQSSEHHRRRQILPRQIKIEIIS